MGRSHGPLKAASFCCPVEHLPSQSRGSTRKLDLLASDPRLCSGKPKIQLSSWAYARPKQRHDRKTKRSSFRSTNADYHSTFRTGWGRGQPGSDCCSLKLTRHIKFAVTRYIYGKSPVGNQREDQYSLRGQPNPRKHVAATCGTKPTVEVAAFRTIRKHILPRQPFLPPYHHSVSKLTGHLHCKMLTKKSFHVEVGKSP